MHPDKHIPNRRPGEKLELFVRRHWVFMVGNFLFTLVLIVIPFILYWMLGRLLPGLLVGSFTAPLLLLLASLYYLYVNMMLFTAFIDYQLDVWVITNHRIIYMEQKGLFNRQVSSHDLANIQDITATQKGILATIFTLGDVQIMTAGENVELILRKVDNPFAVKHKITQVLRKVNPKSKL